MWLDQKVTVRTPISHLILIALVLIGFWQSMPLAIADPAKSQPAVTQPVAPQTSSNRFDGFSNVSLDAVLKQAITTANDRGDKDALAILSAAVIVLALFKEALAPVLVLLAIFFFIRYIPAYLQSRKSQQLAAAQALIPLLSDDKVKAELISDVIFAQGIRTQDQKDRQSNQQHTPTLPGDPIEQPKQISTTIQDALAEPVVTPVAKPASLDGITQE
jgi:hypothetical protein